MCVHMHMAVVNKGFNKHVMYIKTLTCVFLTDLFSTTAHAVVMFQPIQSLSDHLCQTGSLADDLLFLDDNWHMPPFWPCHKKESELMLLYVLSYTAPRLQEVSVCLI